jgi:hypothetical protein
MRFNPHETTGSRVRIRYSVDLRYELAGKSDFLLNVHAAMTPRQQVVEEEFTLSPDIPWTVETDEATGNRIAKFSSEAPELTAHYAGLVDITHRIVDPQDVVRRRRPSCP